MSEYVKMTKEKYELLNYKARDTRIEEANELLLGKALYQNGILISQKQDLKEWLEEEIKNRQDKIDFYENDYSYDMYAEAVCEPTVYKLRQEVKAYKEVLERLG